MYFVVKNIILQYQQSYKKEILTQVVARYTFHMSYALVLITTLSYHIDGICIVFFILCRLEYCLIIVCELLKCSIVLPNLGLAILS